MIRHSFKGKVSKLLIFSLNSRVNLYPHDWMYGMNSFFTSQMGIPFSLHGWLMLAVQACIQFLWWQLSINKSVYFLTLWTMPCLISSCAFLLLNYFLRLISCVKMCVNGFMLCMGFMIHVILLDYIFYDPRGVDFIANMS